MSDKQYALLYADPPWHFRVWSKRGLGRSAEKHYPTQNLEYLKGLNIPAICQDNCILLMWATFPCLEQALELGRAWGFKYKTVAFTWVKKNRIADSLFIGMGYYTRANAEIVLLFTKGKPLKRISKNVPQIFISKRERHSQKPNEIRKRIECLFGNVSRLELFARDNPQVDFKGWDVFGNEVSGTIEIPEKVKK